MKKHIAIILVVTTIFKIIFHGNFFYLLIGVSFAYITGMLPWAAWEYAANKIKSKSKTAPLTDSRNSNVKQPTRAQQSDPKEEALIAAINEQRKSDPLVGAKIGGKELYQRLIFAMKDQQGVHVESLLCALGALAGYACQANVRAQAIINGQNENAGFITVQGGDGKNYFFGDPLNQALYESSYSVWSLAAGTTEEHTKINVHEIFEHVTQTVGTDSFGVPRVPENHKPSDLPANYLKALWPQTFPIIKKFCTHPVEWPVLCGIAIQEAMDASASVISPQLALTLVMESAVPMSKIDISNT